jgi:hypothetical protein
MSVRLPGRVLILKRRTFGAEIAECVNVGVEGMRVVDIERSGVDFVHTEAAVQISQRCDRRANIAHIERSIPGLFGALLRERISGATSKYRI